MNECTATNSPLLLVTVDEDDKESIVSEDKADGVFDVEAVDKPNEEVDAMAEDADAELCKDKMNVLTEVKLILQYLPFLGYVYKEHVDMCYIFYTKVKKVKHSSCK